ncbi:hypothetical protein [Desulfonatronum sp. SC1]|uniref:hypothetical protein n=1 Tax=Desulfonatronum sp. SC1 TaxID=2109626 RepID=UPI000D31CC28|nr:hypothetical protein [Desulfonatronum sp. SC1]PTN32442.1 hypothetical protein C6366_16415 [Desulfonatronum sp. SC1]
MAKKRVLRNPLKAIRAKCLECCGGSPKEVRLCPDISCALHPFRTGTNPFPRRKRKATALPAASETANAPLKPREVQFSLFQD